MKTALMFLILTTFANANVRATTAGKVNVYKAVGSSTQKVCSATMTTSNVHFNTSGVTLYAHGTDTTTNKLCACLAVTDIKTSHADIIESLLTKGFSIHCTTNNITDNETKIVGRAYAHDPGHDITIGK